KEGNDGRDNEEGRTHHVSCAIEIPFSYHVNTLNPVKVFCSRASSCGDSNIRSGRAVSNSSRVPYPQRTATDLNPFAFAANTSTARSPTNQDDEEITPLASNDATCCSLRIPTSPPSTKLKQPRI